MSFYKKVLAIKEMGAESTGNRILCKGCNNRRTIFTLKGSELCAECMSSKYDCTLPTNKPPATTVGSDKQQLTAILDDVDPSKALGFLVYWTIRDCELSKPKLEELLKDSIGTSYLPPTPRKKRALKRALEDAEIEGLVRKIVDDDTKLAYCLVKEIKDKSTIDLTLEKLNIIIFDKTTGDIEFRGDHKNTEIKRLFAKFQTIYTGDDLRKITLDFVKSNSGISMRDSGGGIYFLKDHTDVEVLETFVGSITNNSKLYRFPFQDTKGSRIEMYSLIKHELETELELLAEEVKELSTIDTARRTSTFTNRIDQFKELSAKTSLYRDLLSNDAESISKKIDSLQHDVTEALIGSLGRYPQSDRFPYGSSVEYTGRQSIIDEHGKFGIVVGYFTRAGDNPQDPIEEYVKIQYNKTNVIKATSVKFLTNKEIAKNG